MFDHNIKTEQTNICLLSSIHFLLLEMNFLRMLVSEINTKFVTEGFYIEFSVTQKMVNPGFLWVIAKGSTSKAFKLFKLKTICRLNDLKLTVSMMSAW